MGYLEEARWEREYTSAVLHAQTVKYQDVDARGELSSLKPGGEVTVFYKDLAEFEILAKRFGVMDNIKARVPRTAYHGIVSFWQKDATPPRKVHLAPVGVGAALVKTSITSSTEYDQPPPKRKQNFLRPRIQY